MQAPEPAYHVNTTATIVETSFFAMCRVDGMLLMASKPLGFNRGRSVIDAATPTLNV